MAESAPAPIAIQVENLHKTFRIPTHRVDSLKERVVRPFSNRDYNELRALDGISFEIQQGEFFGIVGRNGSGKSTLLKLMASIYRADSGRIRMAGRLAPFIELGVGFNPELSARENVVLNGVMIGLTPDEMRDRLDAVLDFAELTDFVDLKLKNYSSGMLVRLAFSVMMEADADILLIDEVLAVGDAAFQQKCADAFQGMKAAGKTIILVTHEMSTVERYCHRAMLISDGEILHIGDPAEVGRRYLRLNFEHDVDARSAPLASQSNDVRLLDVWLEDINGSGTTNVERGHPIKLRFEIEARRDLPGLAIGYSLANSDAVTVSQSGTHPQREDGSTAIAAGERVRVDIDLENLLLQGRYFVHLGIHLRGEQQPTLYVHEAIDFVVFGGEEGHGLVSLPQQVAAKFEGRER